MTWFIDSPAVFKQRSYEIGISEPQVDLLIAAGFTTMATFAFCCNFSPGAPDDTPLVAAVTTVLGAAPNAAQMGTFRRVEHDTQHCMILGITVTATHVVIISL